MFVLFGAARNQGNSEKPLVKRQEPVYKSPSFTFACSWWSGAPTASFQVKTEMKTGSFRLSFISDLPHFSISFLTVNGTIVTISHGVPDIDGNPDIVFYASSKPADSLKLPVLYNSTLHVYTVQISSQNTRLCMQIIM
jgi:hypothetical protein